MIRRPLTAATLAAALTSIASCKDTAPFDHGLSQARAAVIASQDEAAAADSAASPAEIIAAAPAGAWRRIPADDLLVMDLAPDARGLGRRVIIQLLPQPFSGPWIANIRLLARAGWWDGLSVNRVQDNYVAQWGDADGDDAAKAKRLPPGMLPSRSAGYLTPRWCGRATCAPLTPIGQKADRQADAYAPEAGFWQGWPMASDGRSAWPVHCYGMVGVGRGMAPDAGSGAELYAVIGHAPRHLDQNIALVGRVIAGIEHLSSLPRGTGALGFYESSGERVGLRAVRLASMMAAADQPGWEVMDTQSPTFQRYASARANRRDPFFIRPAGGADVCNVPVPVRAVR